jgi:hypothetical protein
VTSGRPPGSSLSASSPSWRTRFHLLSNSASPRIDAPGLADDVVARTLLARGHQPQHFNGRSSAEQREDQRLDDAERAAGRARVSPRLEVVSARDVPLRRRGRFVHRVPERDRVRHLRHGRGEVQIGGGVEHGIAAQDDERPDRAVAHRGDERGQRTHARQRRVLRLVVADRAAGVAESVFRAQTAAWTAAGCRSPATISPLPRFARRSLASASIQRGSTPGTGPARPAAPGRSQALPRAPRGTGRSAGSRDGADDPPWRPSASRRLRPHTAGSSTRPRLRRAGRPRTLARDGPSRDRSGAGRRPGRG